MTQVIRIFTISRLKSYTDSEPIVVWSMVEINLGVCSTHSSNTARRNPTNSTCPI